MIYTPIENFIIGYKGYHINQLISEEDYNKLDIEYKDKCKEFNIKNDLDD